MILTLERCTDLEERGGVRELEIINPWSSSNPRNERG